jgi:hypothetical protein
MDRSAHYRDKANHARRLADATWQPNLEDLLRHLAKGYDEAAEDIERDLVFWRTIDLVI